MAEKTERTPQEWFDLTSMDGHVLRSGIDNCRLSDSGWAVVSALTGVKVGDARRHGWREFRCRIEDAPKAATPPFPSQEENPHGLHQKYIIAHTDGKPIDPKAVYFVLRLDGDHPHNQASRFAALEWADVIDDECEALKPVADELRDLVERLMPKAATPPAESPDDWVTQDRDEYNYRRDQRRWVDIRTEQVTDDWEPVFTKGRHGEILSGIFRLELRCRRKDLPPIAEQSPPLSTPEPPIEAKHPIPSIEENPKGLHGKYIVAHADGRPTDPKAVYFVLRLDGDHVHNRASRLAAITWATNAVEDEKLADTAVDLVGLVAKLMKESPEVHP